MVWVGTKYKEQRLGTLPLQCPACNEIVVVDCIAVMRTNTIMGAQSCEPYEENRYARCRICDYPSGIPQDLKPTPDIGADMVRPSPEYIKEAHPDLLLNRTTSSVFDQSRLPDGVSQLHCALIYGIRTRLNNQRTEMFSWIITLGIAGFVMYTVTAFEEGMSTGEKAIAAIPATLILLAFLIASYYALGRISFMKERTYCTGLIMRHLSFRAQSIEELLDDCKLLPGPYAKETKFIEWLQRRIKR